MNFLLSTRWLWDKMFSYHLFFIYLFFLTDCDYPVDNFSVIIFLYILYIKILNFGKDVFFIIYFLIL